MKWPAHSEYKDSGIQWLGKIPRHWNTTRFKYALWLQRGHDLPFTEFRPGVYPVCGSNGSIGYHDQFTTQGPGITVGRSGSVGEVNYIEEDYWAHNTALYVKEFRGTDPKYAFYLLKTLDVSRLSEGTAVGTLNRNYIHDLPIAIPSDVEQCAIAAFLDRETERIDSLIAKKQRQIKLLNEKRAALISHAVIKGLNPDARMKDSGTEWLGEIPAHWEVKRLKHVATGPGCGIQMGPFGSMLKDLAYEDTGYKLYGQENVINEDFRAGQRWLSEKQFHEMFGYRVTPGDILLTRKGSIGNCRILPDHVQEGIIDSDTIRVRVDSHRVIAKFLVLLLHEASYTQAQISASRRGAVLSGLNTMTIADLKICLPPLDEQQELLSSLNKGLDRIGTLVSIVRHGISTIQEYRTALITAAVTGKIDVRQEATHARTAH